MVVDTSAIVGILLNEPERPMLVSLLEDDPHRLVSTVTLLESSIVIEARYGASGIRELDALAHAAEFEAVPFDENQYRIAREAFRVFGKGRHRAGLNFGDCCTYALARSSDQPVLFKGDDFGFTDLTSAV